MRMAIFVSHWVMVHERVEAVLWSEGGSRTDPPYDAFALACRISCNFVEGYLGRKDRQVHGWGRLTG